MRVTARGCFPGRERGGLAAERLFNYEVGAALRWRRLYRPRARVRAELRNRSSAAHSSFLDERADTLAGVPIRAERTTASQREQGVVSVATPLDPRAVKAFVNEGQARYYGVDAQVRYGCRRRWATEGNVFVSGWK